MNIASSSTRLWTRLCEVLGKPEWKDHPDWNTGVGRTQNRAALNKAISEITRQKPAAYWVERFEAAGIPAGPINTIDRVFADPQVQHIGMAAPISTSLFGDTRMVASPLNFTGSKRELRCPAGEPGERTDEVLAWLGYSEKEIGELRAAGVTQPLDPARKEQIA